MFEHYTFLLTKSQHGNILKTLEAYRLTKPYCLYWRKIAILPNILCYKYYVGKAQILVFHLLVYWKQTFQ